MRYELVGKKGEKVIMPVRYSIRRNDLKANVSMDQSFHTCEALAGKVGASMEQFPMGRAAQQTNMLMKSKDMPVVESGDIESVI